MRLGAQGPSPQVMMAASLRDLSLGFFPNLQPKQLPAPSHSPNTVQTSSSSTLVSVGGFSAPSTEMANIPFNPTPLVPHGFEVIHIKGRNGVSRAVVPHRSPCHEYFAIVTIHPLPDEVHFPNVREVLEEFLDVVKHVGVRSIQQCPIGEAYVQFQHVWTEISLLVTVHMFLVIL